MGENIVVFTLSSILLCLAPGPDNLYVFSHALRHGRKSGVLITIGLCIGLLGHITITLGGVAILFQNYPFAYTVLKIIGAMYLLYIAWDFWRTRRQVFNTHNITAKQNTQRLVKKGLLLNITNPKVALFFLAFLPQFADINSDYIHLQMLLLGLLFIIITLVIFSTIAISAEKLGERLNQINHITPFINTAIVGIFMALALKLLLTDIAL